MTGKKAGINGKMYRKPIRIFEKSGSVNPEASYHVHLENVVNTDNQDIKTMVDRGRYFSIFAPRQSGKTTFLKRICEQLHTDPTYVAVILCFEDYKNLDKTEFYSEIEADLYEQLINRLREVRCEKTEAVEQLLNGHRLTSHISFRQLFEKLNRIIQFKKIVIFIDEFDGIPFKELENFLTSLRKLYIKTKDIEQKALYSVGLIGIRNITKLVVGGVSPFNIADQVDLPPFSLKNVRDLYAQYTEETNQPFTKEAIKKVYEETAGQTWLVNRLGTILTVKLKPGTVEPIDEKDVEKAIQILLLERNDHFDNLYEKAKLHKETFIEIIFDHVEYNQYDEEQSWLEQYGLIKNRDGHAVVANNIYNTIHVKAFFKEVKAYETISIKEYALPGDRLDMKRILLNFEKYISRIGVGAFYRQGKPYEKAGQFLLTAWLYQFVRGGEGELHYEVRSGLGRMDIFLTYKGKKYIIETKVNRHDDLSGIIEEGILQLSSKYLASEKTTEGYLVIYDTKTLVGAVCEPHYHQAGDKKVASFTIGIGKPS
ncbi:MAG: AAA family ATPase [Candidatus Aminicenantes bacterium]|nr:AAA family ATPase [Candidatus Aminicenantes bacterium]NIM83014.1 AAA family ATPase [Candidatus Aminicenantes bacterium]NIN22400.1 AAA family ATPase [Candidatus Aminicenantes bacterium]NIN46168.1 AAA family ATPase [Candidatus Aminicenantes bacterium]NIN89006.1 AAA family ATPase [Candidatus Aminicenantes bacterium]